MKIEDGDPQDKAGRQSNADGNVEETAEEITELISEETGSPGVSDIEAEIENLRSQLEAAKLTVEDEHNRYLRAVADFANFKRRRQEEYETQVRFANQELILKLLPIVDNFERALQAAQDNRSFDALAEGVSLTLRQIYDLLNREGVQAIDAVGQEFDPMMHEAVMRVESDEYPENTVVEELEKGYTQNSRVIRPARVKVATR
ncbi:MAG: nucleotide exchange factor GrpE [Armatimonadota bacterium]|nr:nucleotide exchange factor GrpE [Armatimonadota bacterium]